MLPPRALSLFVLCLSVATVVCAEPVAYDFVDPAEPLPTKPWHTHFLDETQRTPAGCPNAGADWCDDFLTKALQGKLKQSAAQTTWDQWGLFLDCALWGYLSPDSEHVGNPRLLDMCRQWLDKLFVRLQTAPTDPKQAEKWHPNSLGTWSMHHYTVPLLEIEARPALKAELGVQRVERFRAVVLENLQRNTTPEAFNDLMGRSETYVNLITHPMAVYVHGWVLTGEVKYLRMAQRILQTLGRDQLPNGMFPYRYRIYGDRHCEFETMYYHAVNVRALYLYWWATGSKQAEDILRKSIPYYPLNLEPPHHFNDGADIWWKDQWRTFWPHHVAMVAAVTGDGENAALANAMARDNVCHDRFDLTLGAHAYQQLALRGVAETPVRTDYVIRDPDIRGVRLRFGRWSATFTTGSFTFTRTSAMRVSDDGKTFSALHLARPYVRVAPLEKAHRTEPDYGTLPAQGAACAAAVGQHAAAVATTFRPALTAATWQEEQPLAPWRMTEVWLLTDRGALGRIDSACLEDMQARELCHMFRFIPPQRDGAGKQTGKTSWVCGDLRLRVWTTDLPFTIEERTRRYALSPTDRKDWQVCLSDADRAPEQLAQDATLSEAERAALKLPAMHDYPRGYHRTSLVEVSPVDGGLDEPATESQGALRILRAQVGVQRYLTVYNAGQTEAPFRAAESARPLAASWQTSAARAPLETLTLPAGGVVLLALP